MTDSMLNQTFGRLTPIEKLSTDTNRKNRLKYLCLCICGNYAEVRMHDLLRGHTKSCGCLKREAIAPDNTKTLNASKYKGVRWNKKESKWEAYYDRWHIGYFMDEERAAHARDYYIICNVMDADIELNFERIA